VIFVDNVATLGIENCLLEPLQRIFTSQVVNNMEDDQVRELAAEPSYISEERDRLGGELEKLQAGLRTLSLFNTQKPFLGRPSLVGMFQRLTVEKRKINLSAVKKPATTLSNDPTLFNEQDNPKPATSASLFQCKYMRFRRTGYD
jgi:hypothetical protein